MEKFRKAVYIILSTIAIVVAVCSLLSIFRNTDSRFLKMLDFPRIQFFITSCISLFLFILLTKRWQWYDYLLVLALTGGMVVHGSYLINYTTLVSQAVPSANKKALSPDSQVSILLVNVKMSNRKVQPLLDLIQSNDIDIIIAMETDDWWNEQLQPIENEYMYTQKAVNNVAYGMILYSKLPLKDVSVNYLSNPKVPSFESVVELKDGRNMLLYSMHPVPPTHYEDLPDNAGEQEMAMTKLGNKIEGDNLPVLVAGDINDVSWGNTDELTGTENLLHDVRVGRGFYNSYNAENTWMRWPLDHIFVTKEFSLVELQRMPNIGSDHFPIYAKFNLKQ